MVQLFLDFFGLRFASSRPEPVRSARGRMDHFLSWKHGITVHIVFRPRARRYLLGLKPDGNARLVIPRRGTEAEGLRFLERSEPWLRKRITHWKSRSDIARPWIDNTRFLFRGEEVSLRVEVESHDVQLSFAGESIFLPHPLSDYRPAVHGHLRSIAGRELPLRTHELALLHGITIQRVTVRAQKTRWGSCSARGTISLNWRLVQAPPFVVDYLIVHELMHRREMNHSARYWKLVAAAFPDYRRAELWLKKSGIELRA